MGYAIRLPSNEVLENQIRHLSSDRKASCQISLWCATRLHYQAGSWERARRVVTKVEWHRDELLPRWGFMVTNLDYPAKGVAQFYNGRGAAEQWIKEGKQSLKWTRLSRHRFVANQVRLWLFILAYNMGNF